MKIKCIDIFNKQQYYKKYSYSSKDFKKSDLENVFSMNFLASIGSVSPFVGLLGTVWGMILTFDVIQSEGLGSIAGLAGGVSQALITTWAGLSVGIPALIAHRWLLSRVDKLSLQFEQEAITLIDVLVHDEDSASEASPDGTP